MNDTPAPADMETQWRRWAAPARAWGPPGNERLTSSVGLVLLVLLGIETLTTLALSSYLPEHIFLGLLLIPPVALKLTSTGWRFFRYYTNSKPYRLEGPPRLLLRLLAPLLVVSTLTLFGSGVALIIVGHGGGPLLQLHAVSFGVWGVLIAIHILAYLTRVLRVGLTDWRRHAAPDVAGDRSRRVALLSALLAGVILALATYPAQDAWLDQRHDHGHDHGHAAALAPASGDGVEASFQPFGDERRTGVDADKL
jgi:hypothetical protein